MEIKLQIMKTKLLAAVLTCLAIGTQAAVVYSQPFSGGSLLPSSWWTPDGSDYDQYA